MNVDGVVFLTVDGVKLISDNPLLDDVIVMIKDFLFVSSLDCTSSST
jgi:hypothetical protein